MPEIDFLLIGAMKAGTTTLVDYLRRHPQIFFPAVKELQYFSRDEKYANGLGWYESFFTGAQKNQVRGEGSTCYSRWPRYAQAAARIHQYCPDVKLIYVVREPVARTYSHYRHSFLANEISYETFAEALSQDDELIRSSLYMTQIEQYLQYFHSNQFFFVKFEDLVAGDRKIFSGLCEFLGVDDIDIVGDTQLSSNQAGFVHARVKITNMIKLAKYIPGLSHIVKSRFSENQRRQIIQRLATRVTHSPVGKLLSKKKARLVPEMLPEDRDLISAKCVDDLKAFESFSKLDLSQWYETSSKAPEH